MSLDGCNVVGGRAQESVCQSSKRTSGCDLIADLRHIRVVGTSASPANCVDAGRLRQERRMRSRTVPGLEEMQLDPPCLHVLRGLVVRLDFTLMRNMGVGARKE